MIRIVDFETAAKCVAVNMYGAIVGGYADVACGAEILNNLVWELATVGKRQRCCRRVIVYFADDGFPTEGGVVVPEVPLAAVVVENRLARAWTTIIVEIKLYF